MAAVSQLHDIRFITMDRIQFIDEELVCFSNINTAADLEQIIQRGANDYG
jgi:molybdopterin-guanine dinucleotide biosynthesis protein A